MSTEQFGSFARFEPACALEFSLENGDFLVLKLKNELLCYH